MKLICKTDSPTFLNEERNVRTTTFSSKQDTFSLAFSLQAPHLWKVKFAFPYLDQIYQKSIMGEDYTNMLLKKEKKKFQKGLTLDNKGNHIWPLGHM